MSSGRDAILARVRKSLARGPVDDGTRAELQARLSGHPRGIIPARSNRDHGAQVDLFVEMAEAVAATVDRVASPDGVPDAVGDYLAQHNLGADIRMAPDDWLESIDWTQRPTLAVTKGPSAGKDEVSVTAAFSAVAETGTLLLHSGPSSPTTLNFLPDNHVVVLRSSQVVGAYEDAWDQLRAAGAMPRAVNFITGPSRTGDIEQTIMLGAHGPRRLHIILVDDG
ncbi:MAG: lactate utilization protein C [Alphaproteobacteria bacterium]|nr:lactate utilization protein C [Alphaproteobacteria bacterium]